MGNQLKNNQKTNKQYYETCCYSGYSSNIFLIPGITEVT